MHIFSGHSVASRCVLVAALASSLHAVPSAAVKSATLQSVTVSSNAGGISVEIAASQNIAVRSQVATEPDRLVLDFPNAQPGDLHSKLLNQGDIKGFRVARYSANPLVTRVVIDLNSPQRYQIFPDGKTVIVKLTSEQQQASGGAQLNNVAYNPEPPKPASTMEVQYQNGQLIIAAHNASLSDVLAEVHRKTGTDIPIPPGAAQEQIVANIGPAPIREALVALLNGSRFNFIMVDSDREPGKLKSVILTYRGAGGVSQPNIAAPEPAVTESAPEPEPAMQPEPEAQQPPQDGNPQDAAPPRPEEVPPPQ